MMGKYYTEQIEKDTSYRKEYEEGMAEFLQREHENATKQRHAVYTPEKFKADQGKYRAQFMEMLGFPLNKERETPTLIEKVFVVQDGNVNIYRMQSLFCGCIMVIRQALMKA